jgi:hypothetical protein
MGDGMHKIMPIVMAKQREHAVHAMIEKSMTEGFGPPEGQPITEEQCREFARALAERCRVFTVSAQAAGPEDTASIGTAAHIHAAAEGGPRYDSSQSSEERRGIGNAVWLCASCARLIDSDVAAHAPPLLQEWKVAAEHEARARIGKRATTIDEANAEERLRVTSKLDALMRQTSAVLPSIRTAFARPLDLRPPPLVSATIARSATVERILGSLSTRRWLAIHGEVAIGKTHLAALLATARGESLWIRARGVEAPEAAARIEEAMALRNGDLPPTVVVDDLPLVRDELIGALVHLLQGTPPEVLVISTSNHRLGSRILEHVNADAVQEEPCPGLSDNEAADLLRAHGAQNLSDKSVAFLNALAHHHPALLTAISRHLSARDWVWSNETLGALFAREHLSDLRAETLRALTESVRTETSRALLYRLTLVRGAFDEGLAGLLAEVSPPLTLIHERLAELDGLWIQRQNSDRYTTSPLLTSLPSTVVDEGTRIGCYRRPLPKALPRPDRHS